MKRSRLSPLIALAASLALVPACTPEPSSPGTAKDNPGDAPAAENKAAKPTAPPYAPRAAVDGPRMIILGFDGVDPGRVDTMIKAGKLPNLKALGDNGHRGPLATTNPPQSPVAWSAFATGMPPGRHGIFDFIGRDSQSYFPKVATSTVQHASLSGGQVIPAKAENLRKGESFWDVIAKGGVAAQTLAVPYAYPPPKGGAHSLGGLGTPDVRGTNSVFTLLTTDVAKSKGSPPAGGQIALLTRLGDGLWQATVQGPTIKKDGKRQKTNLQIIIRKVEAGLKLEMGGSSVTVAPGTTSAYQTVQFIPDPELTINAATRATVHKAGTDPEIFLEPFSIVPDAAYLPVSEPPGLASHLWHKHGAFKTVGWVHDTSALGAGAIDEDQFLREAMETMDRRARITLKAVKARTDKLLISVFTAPDRIGHTFYRYIDAKHKAATPGDKVRFAGALDKSYERMDAIVGEVTAALGPDDVLLVMSDHGFDSFRRGVHLNTWLLKNGYLALKPGTAKPKDFFLDVDWSKTKAYALGTGSIFLNIKGRERLGIVPKAQAVKVGREIAKKLMGLKDGKTRVVRGVFFGDKEYSGPERKNAPELRVALTKGYRASWATTLGGIPNDLFDDNTKKWSGDHASAHPDDVPGILLSNRKIQGKPRIEDLSATAYKFTGVAKPSHVIGRDLL